MLLSLNSPGLQQTNLLVEEERSETWAGLVSTLKSSSRPGLSIFRVFMLPSRPVKYFPSSSRKATKPPWTSKEYMVCAVTSDTSEPLEAKSLPAPFLNPYFFTGDRAGEGNKKRLTGLGIQSWKIISKWMSAKQRCNYSFHSRMTAEVFNMQPLFPTSLFSPLSN